MPKFTSRDITVALDMCGCPNRCRHCWLGRADNRRMTERDLRWAVERFRTFVRKGQTEPFFTGVKASASWREPDFSDDYQRLRDLECELSDGEPWRFELLSVWRLARDETYARWARTVGPDTCQITFFGLEQTTDWFCRRRGAFRDGIIATQRLLDAGIKPRWQFFLTRKILPDLPGLLKLVETLKLPERAAALGGEFTLFMHTPGPSGQARHIEHLRPTIDQIAEAAGMSKPNLLYYFKSKEDIHAPLLARILDTWLQPLRELDEKGDPLPELQSYIRRKLEMSRDFPRQSRLFANEILQGAPRIMPMLEGELKALVDEKAAIIER